MEIELPKDSAILWRYIDFVKFVSLLSTSAIYMPRVDQLEDPFEGALGPKDRREVFEISNEICYYLEHQRPDYDPDNPPEESPKERAEAKQHVQDEISAARERRKWTFVSCWCETSHESEAMWKIFCGDPMQGLAIKSRYSKLYRIYDKIDLPKLIGRVSYIDYRQHFADYRTALFRKRVAFEHEKEVRMTVENRKIDAFGISVNIDPSEFIEEIVISPLAPCWYEKLVNDVVKKFGVSIPVKISEMTIEPF